MVVGPGGGLSWWGWFWVHLLPKEDATPTPRHRHLAGGDYGGALSLPGWASQLLSSETCPTSLGLEVVLPFCLPPQSPAPASFHPQRSRGPCGLCELLKFLTQWFCPQPPAGNLTPVASVPTTASHDSGPSPRGASPGAGEVADAAPHLGGAGPEGSV